MPPPDIDIHDCPGGFRDLFPLLDLHRLVAIGDRMLRDFGEADAPEPLCDPALADRVLDRGIEAGELGPSLGQEALAVFQGRTLPATLLDAIQRSGLPEWEFLGRWLLHPSISSGTAAETLRLLWRVLARRALRCGGRGELLPPFCRGARHACRRLGLASEERAVRVKALAKRLKRALRAAEVEQTLGAGLALRLDERGLLLLRPLDEATRARILANCGSGGEPIANRSLRRWIGREQAARLAEQDDADADADVVGRPLLPPTDGSRRILAYARRIEDEILEMGVVVAVRLEVLGLFAKSPVKPALTPEAPHPNETPRPCAPCLARDGMIGIQPGTQRRAWRHLQDHLAPAVRTMMLPCFRAASPEGGLARSDEEGDGP